MYHSSFVLNRITNNSNMKISYIDLITHRGGCIICMDYSDYNDDYGFLLVNFRSIAKILTNKLEMLKSLSFPSESAYLFGFSYGARLIAKAGNDFGSKEIGTIHCMLYR